MSKRLKEGIKSEVSQATTIESSITPEEIDELILSNRGWAESIARSVARAWNMDWQQDGLDGAAMEALIFCARRFDPARGVPFRGYARRRIHEASTEEARQSKKWRNSLRSGRTEDGEAKEISTQLFDLFPELRTGELPLTDLSGTDGDQVRSAVRTLLVSATIIATRRGFEESLPDDRYEYKRMIELIATLETVHQTLLWKGYWEGLSLRRIAEEWDVDELNVMREHKVLVDYLHKRFSKNRRIDRPRVRPGLRKVALAFKKAKEIGPFKELLNPARE